MWSNGKLILSTIILLVIALTLSSCKQSEENKVELVRIHIKQAESYIKSGQYRAATIEARNVIQKAPDSSKGFELLATIYSKLGQHKNALVILEQAPQSPENKTDYQLTKLEALNGRGKFRSILELLDNQPTLREKRPIKTKLFTAKAHAGLGNLEQAEKLFQSILAQQSDNLDALEGMAQLNIKTKNFSEAKNLLEKMDSVAPNSTNSALLRAQISLISGDLDAAESQLSDALTTLKNADTITPEKASILRALSEVLVKQGRSAEALIYTQTLANAFPGYEIAEEQYTLAATQFKSGDIDAAEKILNALIEDFPNFENASLMLAVINYRKGNFNAASSHFNPNVDPELTHPDITRLTALSNLQTNRPDLVIQLLRDYKGKDRDPKLLTIYGSSALAEGLTDEGVKALKQAIALDASMLPAYTALARYHALLTPPETEMAKNYLQKAYQLENTNTVVATQLVRQLVVMEQFTEAKSIVDQQIQIRNKDALSLRLAGDYHAASENFNEAKKYYKNALEQEPNDYWAALKLAELSAHTADPFSESLAAYQHAIKIQPENPTGYMYFLRAGQTNNQQALVEKSINEWSTTNKHDVGFAILAIYFSSQNNIASAEKYMLKINTDVDTQKINQDLWDEMTLKVYYAKAQASFKSNKLVEAKENIFSALRVAPTSLRLLTLLTEIEIAAKNFVEANKLATQIETQSEVLGLQLHGNIAEAQADTDTAITLYQKAWKVAPSEPLAQRLFSLLEKNKPTQVSLFLKEWLRTSPNSIFALLAHSRDILVAGQFKQAIPIMEKVREQVPENTTNLNNLAWAYQQIGDKQAISTAEKAYQLAPGNAAIADTYGWILFQNSQIDKAIPILEAASAQDPKNQEIADHLKQAKKER